MTIRLIRDELGDDWGYLHMEPLKLKIKGVVEKAGQGMFDGDDYKHISMCAIYYM